MGVGSIMEGSLIIIVIVTLLIRIGAVRSMIRIRGKDAEFVLATLNKVWLYLFGGLIVTGVIGAILALSLDSNLDSEILRFLPGIPQFFIITMLIIGSLKHRLSIESNYVSTSLTDKQALGHRMAAWMELLSAIVLLVGWIVIYIMVWF